MDHVEQLFGDYDYYRFHTRHAQQLRDKGAPVGALKRTPERQEALSRMHDWCTEQGMDPRLWLYVLFRSVPSRRWLYPPRWNQLVPKHPKKNVHVQLYYELPDAKLFKQRMAQTRKPAMEVDPNKDIIPSAELVKQGFIQKEDPEGCFLEIEHTYGYHPDSPWCTVCPKAEACAAQLTELVGFDIMALREGRITAAQAQSQVRGRK